MICAYVRVSKRDNFQTVLPIPNEFPFGEYDYRPLLKELYRFTENSDGELGI